jgi:hypothetical protein
VFEVPRHEAISGAVSGRQIKQGRNPASCAAAADPKNRQFSNFADRAGQTGRQYTPVDVTPTNISPSKRASLLRNAR